MLDEHHATRPAGQLEWSDRVLLDHGAEVRQRCLDVLARTATDGFVSLDYRGAVGPPRHRVGYHEEGLGDLRLAFVVPGQRNRRRRTELGWSDTR